MVLAKARVFPNAARLGTGREARVVEEALARVSYLIGFGHSGAMIVEAVKERARFGQQPIPSCAVVQRLDEAVELAARIAGPKSIVLLSPGGTSYDAYRDFEQRGEHFRRLACKAPGGAT